MTGRPPRRGRSVFRIAGVSVRRGETKDIQIPVSELYTGVPVHMPVRVIRSAKAGPTVFISAAVHGDEVNGTGIIRQLLFGDPIELTTGTLICMPVVNVFGFEENKRYLPDGRDLNRSFPGSPRGSLASRFAERIMTEIVSRCDYGLDLHSAGAGRTNFPNVRGNLRVPGVRELAKAMGCELIVSGKGPEGSFRRAACDSGCPTVILEAGEVGRIEPAVMDIGLRGVRNVLMHLGMMSGEHRPPAYQVTVTKTTWIRAELGGLLRFHVAPGDIVRPGQPIASNESVFGDTRSIIIAPAAGIVLGMTIHPAVKPGEPICHLALPGRKLSGIRRAVEAIPDTHLDSRIRADLASSLAVTPNPRTEAGRRKKRSSSSR